jgi:hypothetical protein
MIETVDRIAQLGNHTYSYPNYYFMNSSSKQAPDFPFEPVSKIEAVSVAQFCKLLN